MLDGDPLPTGWRGSSVAEEFDVASGLTLGPHRRAKSHPYPYLRVANVHRNRLDLSDVAELEARPNELRGKTLVEGDLLIVEGHANPAEIGRCARATRAVEGFTFQNHLFRLRSNSILDGFALRALNSLLARNYWRRVCSTSSGLNTINRTKLGKMPLVLPPLPEQRRIAEILDTVDQAIRKTEEIIAKLKQVKQGLLHDLLTRGIDDNGELRDPDRHPEQFKDSPLGRIPKAWEVAPLREYGSARRPYLKTGPFGTSLKQEHWVDEGVPVVTIGSLGEGHFTPSELLFVSETTARSLAAYALEPGDIVFSRVADVGRSVVIRPHHAGWIMSSNMMWISLDGERVVPDFVQANIAGNRRVREQIVRYVNSGGRDVANATVMNQLRFPWPGVGEQRAIAKVIQTIGERIDRDQGQLFKLRLLKQGLMEDLLTGGVRVTALLEEAAE